MGGVRESDFVSYDQPPVNAPAMRRALGVSPQTTFTLSALIIVVAAVIRVETGFSSLKESQTLAFAASMAPVVKAQNDMQQSLALIEYRMRLLETRDSAFVPYSVFRAFMTDLKERNPTMVVPAVQ
jgi:hypothetical protein